MEQNVFYAWNALEIVQRMHCKTTLKHDEVLYWTLSKQEYEYPAEIGNLSVRFRVITEYCDPNYENNYPEEYTVLLDPISVKAEFGGTYHITITGDK